MAAPSSRNPGWTMSIGIYVINLDRSVDRWNALSDQARALPFDLVRIAGVDGREVSAEQRNGLDERAFQRNNGRTVLAGEYGCYRSHLKALAAFLETGEAACIIVEDDIILSADLALRAEAALAAVPGADVIKLVNHRIVGFRPVATSDAGDEIGRATHGPQGSAACYAVTRTGARKLLDQIAIMRFPWDIELERGWASRAQIYTTRGNVTDINEGSSNIGTRSVYRATKFRWWKRLPTYAVRIAETIRRINYAMKK
ncbi:glycosyl transferase family 25 [Rhizobium sp. BK650]|uniref:glycosyltransferase family 25 protein n=1 Tax=Rhizobium sp. BK650 TaxID=2586990 RepID=UPI0018137023|nr:glycosyltransferase family 25 protein [Rhizobium sp. BK650]MBB3655627.1 glycosyl transferase family 25 [Rhizobium sp. BK650]